jgi:hypothetical protein
MAGYKAHLATGMFIGLTSGIGFVLFVVVPAVYAPLIFLAVVIGSFLPDLDSDSGIPVRILFLGLGIIISTSVGYYLFNTVEATVYAIILGCIVTFVFINIGLKHLFKKITTHRGIFHSLVAVIITILFLNTVFLAIGLDIFDSLLFSVAVGIGYLGHLVLDESNSIVNLSGIPFIPKKSLGTALKISTSSARMNIMIILLVTVLIYVNGRLINQ